MEYSEQTRCQRSLWIVVVSTWRRGMKGRNGQLVGIEGTGKISTLIITSNMGIWRKRKDKKRKRDFKRVSGNKYPRVSEGINEFE